MEINKFWEKKKRVEEFCCVYFSISVVSAFIRCRRLLLAWFRCIFFFSLTSLKSLLWTNGTRHSHKGFFEINEWHWLFNLKRNGFLLLCISFRLCISICFTWFHSLAGDYWEFLFSLSRSHFQIHFLFVFLINCYSQML